MILLLFGGRGLRRIVFACDCSEVSHWNKRSEESSDSCLVTHISYTPGSSVGSLRLQGFIANSSQV